MRASTPPGNGGVRPPTGRVFAVLPCAGDPAKLTAMNAAAVRLFVRACVALTAGAVLAWGAAGIAAGQTTSSSTSTTDTTVTTTVSTTITAPPKTTTETATKTVTQTTLVKNNTTTTVLNQGTPEASKSSTVAWWVWVLIGLGAIGVAVAIFQLGRSSGDKRASGPYPQSGQGDPYQRPGPNDPYDGPPSSR